MSDQRLTDEELSRMERELTDAVERDGELYLTTDAPRDMRRLLAELRRTRAEIATTPPTCGHNPDWSCRLGPRCACAQIAHHGDRHRCACGSWWYDNMDDTPKPTPTGGIVVSMEPSQEVSKVEAYAIGYSVGLRHGRDGHP